MGKGTLIGLIVGLGAFVFGIIMAVEGNFVMAGMMIDIPSIIIVGVGGAGSALMSTSVENFTAAMKALKIAFGPPVIDPAAAINQIVVLANTARKEGVLALEDSASSMEDEFLKKGIMLIVDGTDPELVKGIMETEASYIDERHAEVAGVWDALNGFFPAWGMIGTLVGLIIMLADLTDMDALASSMGIALITTLYGSLFANAIAGPFAQKLKNINGKEVLLKTVLIEGMLSIQAGENPRIIEEKLKSFLAPMLRDSVGEGSGGGDE